MADYIYIFEDEAPFKKFTILVGSKNGFLRRNLNAKQLELFIKDESKAFRKNSVDFSIILLGEWIYCYLLEFPIGIGITKSREIANKYLQQKVVIDENIHIAISDIVIQKKQSVWRNIVVTDKTQIVKTLEFFTTIKNQISSIYMLPDIFLGAHINDITKRKNSSLFDPYIVQKGEDVIISLAGNSLVCDIETCNDLFAEYIKNKNHHKNMPNVFYYHYQELKNSGFNQELEKTKKTQIKFKNIHDFYFFLNSGFKNCANLLQGSLAVRVNYKFLNKFFINAVVLSSLLAIIFISVNFVEAFRYNRKAKIINDKARQIFLDKVPDERVVNLEVQAKRYSNIRKNSDMTFVDISSMIATQIKSSKSIFVNEIKFDADIKSYIFTVVYSDNSQLKKLLDDLQQYNINITEVKTVSKHGKNFTELEIKG